MQEDIELEAEIAKAEEQMRTSLIEAGIDPDNFRRKVRRIKRRKQKY